jgi:hypothetical protein
VRHEQHQGAHGRAWRICHPISKLAMGRGQVDAQLR